VAAISGHGVYHLPALRRPNPSVCAPDSHLSLALIRASLHLGKVSPYPPMVYAARWLRRLWERPSLTIET
jgi:hypothetical protein